MSYPINRHTTDRRNVVPADKLACGSVAPRRLCRGCKQYRPMLGGTTKFVNGTNIFRCKECKRKQPFANTSAKR